MNLSKSALRQAMTNVNRLHFIGIGGVGMSGIAELFHNLGFSVSGSDQKQSIITNRLADNGIKIFHKHESSNVVGANVVVVSTAIDANNPEKLAAQKQGITIIRRAEMLAELMRFRFSIAVAGTHGKTTTTSLVASILSEGGLDPTYVIGGKLTSSSVNAKLGSGHYLVAEADESDASFLHLNPMLSIITNIDLDHMETYDGSVDKLHHSFIEFVHNLPFYGKVIVCIEDQGVQAILSKISRQIITYGFDMSADICAYNIKTQGTTVKFDVKRTGANDLNIILNMPGKHNVLNALAAIAVASELNIDDSSVINALKIFHGIGRRFELYGNFVVNNHLISVIDDYGHHPKELAATIQTTKDCYPDKRLVMIFQPHRYTRTRDLFDDFISVLSSVDCLILLEVYPAGEDEIIGACARSLAKAIRATAKIELVIVTELEKAINMVEKILKTNDLLLISGAGNIGMLAPEIAQTWQKSDD